MKKKLRGAKSGGGKSVKINELEKLRREGLSKKKKTKGRSKSIPTHERREGGGRKSNVSHKGWRGKHEREKKFRIMLGTQTVQVTPKGKGRACAKERQGEVGSDWGWDVCWVGFGLVGGGKAIFVSEKKTGEAGSL